MNAMRSAGAIGVSSNITGRARADDDLRLAVEIEIKRGDSDTTCERHIVGKKLTKNRPIDAGENFDMWTARASR